MTAKQKLSPMNFVKYIRGAKKRQIPWRTAGKRLINIFFIEIESKHGEEEIDDLREYLALRERTKKLVPVRKTRTKAIALEVCRAK